MRNVSSIYHLLNAQLELKNRIASSIFEMEQQMDNFSGVTSLHNGKFVIYLSFAISCYGERRVGSHVLTYEFQFLGLLGPWLRLHLLDRRGSTG
jgi:hypothetical protein